MNKAAVECAAESGDSVANHCSVFGDWSMETIKRVLSNKGFEIKRGVISKKKKLLWDIPTMYELLYNDNVYGFIIHEPNHFTAYRKTNGSWEYANSMEKKGRLLDPYIFCENALKGTWNIFLVMSL